MGRRMSENLTARRALDLRSAGRCASKHCWSVSALLCVLYRTPRNKTRQCRVWVVQISKEQLQRLEMLVAGHAAWVLLDSRWPGPAVTPPLPLMLTFSLSCPAQRKMPFVSMAQQDAVLCHQPGRPGHFRRRRADLKAGFRPRTNVGKGP